MHGCKNSALARVFYIIPLYTSCMYKIIFNVNCYNYSFILCEKQVLLTNNCNTQNLITVS